MIKPVEVGLRFLAILAKCFVELIGSPLEALDRLLRLLCHDVLAPFVEQMDKLINQLEESAKEPKKDEAVVECIPAEV